MYSFGLRSYRKKRFIRDLTVNQTLSLKNDFGNNYNVVIVNRINSTAIRTLMRLNKSSFEYGTVHIIMGQTPDIFYNYFKTENPLKLLKRARQLHLLVFTSDDVRPEDIAPVLVYLWGEFSILNVVAQIPCSWKYRTILITYRPFVKIRDTYGQVQLYKLSDVLSNPLILQNNLINMNEYQIMISQFERYPTAVRNPPLSIKESRIYRNVKDTSMFYGLDGVIVSELSRILNFSVSLQENENNNYYGMILRNGSLIGALAEVACRRTQIQANTRFFAGITSDWVEYTNLFHFDKVCLMVPKSEQVPKWAKMYKILRTKLGITIVAVILLSSIINFFLRRCTGMSNHETFWEMYCLALGCYNKNVLYANPQLPRRIFLGSCMLFFIVFSTILTANLFEEFSTQSYYPDIDTLEQLDKSGLVIKSSISIFRNNSNGLSARLARKTDTSWKNITSTQLAITTKRYAAMGRLQDAKIQIPTKYSDEEGTPLLHVVAECINSVYMGFIVSTGSPYLLVINELLQKFHEGGFYWKWYSDFGVALIVEARAHSNYTHHDLKPFQLRDIQSAFYILCLGLGISIVGFFMEIYWKQIVESWKTLRINYLKHIRR
ncbi:hypothetical protein GWI33_021996 [Rhynchophorus ferrugineus]|uniref:Uncharacterized protein n=1 Tax=Rhynchophorus ferrugineus TaxID=354439 RepID=A0A834MI40_RHYFE|nr:hypothetical protein GWI33_021996 [Rhynchophorus ferrugineus]